MIPFLFNLFVYFFLSLFLFLFFTCFFFLFFSYIFCLLRIGLFISSVLVCYFLVSKLISVTMQSMHWPKCTWLLHAKQILSGLCFHQHLILVLGIYSHVHLQYYFQCFAINSSCLLFSSQISASHYTIFSLTSSIKQFIHQQT